MARDRNTFAKRQRETGKKQKAEQKRARRRKRKELVASGAERSRREPTCRRAGSWRSGRLVKSRILPVSPFLCPWRVVSLLQLAVRSDVSPCSFQVLSF